MILKTLFTLFFSFSLLFLFSQNKDSKRIIVVGAGISGLSTAKTLKNSGFEVLVLEAQGKAGGRIKTDRSLNFPFDEGASWIHGPDNNPISKIAINGGASTFLTDDESLSVYDNNGKELDDKLLDNEYLNYLKALKKIQRKANKNESFEERFNLEYGSKNENLIWQYMLSAYLEFDIGGDISDLSAKYFYSDEEFEGEDVIITNGYDLIIEELSKGINIQYFTEVKSINYVSDKVEVKSEYQNYKADAVVVTVPLGVLKKEKIEFNPSLPLDKKNAIERLKMGTVNKFVLEWDSAFWDTKTQYIGFTDSVKGKFNYFMNCNTFMEKNVLMTFSFGNYSVETENLSDSIIIHEIMKNLYTIYGNDIPKPIAFKRTKWNTNEYTYGSYSFASKNSEKKDFEILAKSIDKKLYFAGEHTSQSYRGTVHGAYLSGIREAENIIKNLK